jgi:heme-degrading monooxygenase HmoA
MFIRFGSFPVKPGQAAQLRSKYNDVAAPKVRACAGSLGCLLLEPADESESFAVMTLWATRADAEAYEASGTAAEVVALVKEFFAGPPTLRSYESASVAL